MILKKIQWYIDAIEEELDGAATYAEKYFLNKGWSTDWAKKYSTMANDELRHAEYMKQIGEEHIKMLGNLPDEDVEAWECCIKHYTEKYAAIMLLLSR